MTEFDQKQAIGEPVPGTKIFRKDGPESELPFWFEAINAIAGDVVSPGGANMYCPVSRAAVHKRLKEGKLTGYFFYPTTPKRNLFGKKVQKRTDPYGYIPISELKEWAKEIEEKAIKLGHVTREDLEGNEPDWYGDFLKWNSKFNKQKQRKE